MIIFFFTLFQLMKMILIVLFNSNTAFMRLINMVLLLVIETLLQSKKRLLVADDLKITVERLNCFILQSISCELVNNKAVIIIFLSYRCTSRH